MSKLFTSVAAQWFVRRILDWGGWLGSFLLGVIGLYNSLPPEAQEAIQTVIAGRWQDITLGSLIPLIALIWSQIASFRATVRPQVVIDGKQIDIKDMGAKAVVVEEYARSTIHQKRTLLDRLMEQLNRPER